MSTRKVPSRSTIEEIERDTFYAARPHIMGALNDYKRAYSCYKGAIYNHDLIKMGSDPRIRKIRHALRLEIDMFKKEMQTQRNMLSKLCETIVRWDAHNHRWFSINPWSEGINGYSPKVRYTELKDDKYKGVRERLELDLLSIYFEECV